MDMILDQHHEGYQIIIVCLFNPIIVKLFTQCTQLNLNIQNIELILQRKKPPKYFNIIIIL